MCFYYTIPDILNSSLVLYLLLDDALWDGVLRSQIEVSAFVPTDEKNLEFGIPVPSAEGGEP